MIPQVNQQVITLEVEMHNVLRVQILHPKRRVHRNDEPLPKIGTPFKRLSISYYLLVQFFRSKKKQGQMQEITCPSAEGRAEENRSP
jgi:hypothetical protein